MVKKIYSNKYNMSNQSNDNNNAVNVSSPLTYRGKIAAELPETSPGEVELRRMLGSRWSMLGTGWD